MWQTNLYYCNLWVQSARRLDTYETSFPVSATIAWFSKIRAVGCSCSWRCQDGLFLLSLWLLVSVSLFTIRYHYVLIHCFFCFQLSAICAGLAAMGFKGRITSESFFKKQLFYCKYSHCALWSSYQPSASTWEQRFLWLAWTGTGKLRLSRTSLVTRFFLPSCLTWTMEVRSRLSSLLPKTFYSFIKRGCNDYPYIHRNKSRIQCAAPLKHTFRQHDIQRQAFYWT